MLYVGARLDCATLGWPAGEYCYPAFWSWVEDGSKSLSFNVSLSPTGDTYRGMQVSSQKTPWGMFRSRYTGSSRYATVPVKRETGLAAK